VQDSREASGEAASEGSQSESGKRFGDLRFTFVLVLLILLPVFGLWLYGWLQKKPEPDQRFIAKISPTANLELVGVTESPAPVDLVACER